MKILMLKDTYPPFGGGIGQACRSMAEALAARGHHIDVLTTTSVRGKADTRLAVLPLLEPFPPRPALARLFGYPRRQRHNRRVLSRLLRPGAYDLVMVWKFWEVSDSALHQVQRSGLPVIYYLHDEWMIPGRKGRWELFWSREPQRTDLRLLKGCLKITGTKALLERLLGRWFAGGPEPPDPESAVFVSRSCVEEYRDAGLPLADPVVIPNGIDLRHFHPRKQGRNAGRVRLLFVGRIQPLKGLHVLIEALSGDLGHCRTPWTLDVVGPVEDVAYAEEVTASAHSAGLSDRIAFLGPIAHDDLAQCYRDHDILVFPSIGTERFPLVIVEAMASGLPIVTTLTGGQDDFLVDAKNCLVFRPGDAQHLAQRLRLLLDDTGLRTDIASAGAETVRTRLSLEETCSQMEEFLATRLR